MQRRRLVTCQYLQGQTADEIRHEEIPAEAWEVLDSLDSIGIYVNRGVVEEELAWVGFYYWLNAYWHVLAAHREALRQEHDGTEDLGDIEPMSERLTAYGVRHRGLAGLESRCSARRIARFIEEELRSTEAVRFPADCVASTLANEACQSGWRPAQAH
jgi:hypothetical protein